MTKYECKYFDDCEAPLCPLDEPENLEAIVWYTDGKVCRRQRLPEGPLPKWVRTQRRIVKNVTPARELGYFTKQMLERIILITPAIRGLDPDRDHDTQLKTWLAQHPGERRRVLSEAEKEILRERLRKVRERLRFRRGEISG